jgi:hypothetical protein
MLNHPPASLLGIAGELRN